MKLKQPLVYPGLVVEALEVALSDQLEQITIAPVVLGEESKMIGAFAGGIAADAICLGDVDLAAYYGLDPFVSGRRVEIDDAIHGAVVGDGQAVHAQLLRSGDKLGNAAHAIEEAVFSVDVKMGELPRHRSDYSICAGSPPSCCRKCP